MTHDRTALFIDLFLFPSIIVRKIFWSDAFVCPILISHNVFTLCSSYFQSSYGVNVRYRLSLRFIKYCVGCFLMANNYLGLLVKRPFNTIMYNPYRYNILLPFFACINHCLFVCRSSFKWFKTMSRIRNSCINSFYLLYEV